MKTITIKNDSYEIVKSYTVQEAFGDLHNLVERALSKGITNVLEVKRPRGKVIYHAYLWANGEADFTS